MKVSILVDEKNIKKGKEKELFNDVKEYIKNKRKDPLFRFLYYLEENNLNKTESRLEIVSEIITKKKCSPLSIFYSVNDKINVNIITVVSVFKLALKAGIIKEHIQFQKDIDYLILDFDISILNTTKERKEIIQKMLTYGISKDYGKEYLICRNTYYSILNYLKNLGLVQTTKKTIFRKTIFEVI